MLVDFDWKVIKLDFPFKVDEVSVDNKVEIKFPDICYSRSDVIRWWNEAGIKFGIELNHEPFFDGTEKPNTVMKKIEKQRIKVDGEDYIDDFGFYVYFITTEELGLKDNRYD